MRSLRRYPLGIAALDAGHLTRAIFALELTVELQPANNLARAELAHAYLAAGETANARKALLEAACRPKLPPLSTACWAPSTRNPCEARASFRRGTGPLHSAKKWGIATGRALDAIERTVMAWADGGTAAGPSITHFYV